MAQFIISTCLFFLFKTSNRKATRFHEKRLTLAGTSCQHPARVIRSLCRDKLHQPIYGILRIKDWPWTRISLKKGNSLILEQQTTSNIQLSTWSHVYSHTDRRCIQTLPWACRTATPAACTLPQSHHTRHSG